MKNHKLFFRVLFYVMGMLILALGLTLNAKTNLGVSPVTSLPYTVSQIMDINFGNTVFISYVIFVCIELIMAKKGTRLLISLQLPTSLLFTRLMNVYNIMINVQFSNIFQNLLLLFISIIFTGLGAALTLSTKLVPNPVDGIVQALAEGLHKKVGITKNFFDFMNAFISLCLGWIAGSPLLGVGIGTVFCVFGVGRVIAVFNRYLKAWIQDHAGIIDNALKGPMKEARLIHSEMLKTVEVEEH